jgi:hypothetical protein
LAAPKNCVQKKGAKRRCVSSANWGGVAHALLLGSIVVIGLACGHAQARPISSGWPGAPFCTGAVTAPAQGRQHGQRRAGRAQVFEGVARHPLAGGGEHRVVGRLEQLGRAVPGDHGKEVQRQRARAPWQTGQRQHHQHAAELHHGPGQQVAGMRPPSHGQRPGQQHHHGAGPAGARTHAAGRRQAQQSGEGHGHAQPVPQQAGIVGPAVVPGRAQGGAQQAPAEQRGQGARGAIERIALAPQQRQAPGTRHGERQVAQHVERAGQAPQRTLVGKAMLVRAGRQHGAEHGQGQQRQGGPEQAGFGGGAAAPGGGEMGHRMRHGVSGCRGWHGRSLVAAPDSPPEKLQQTPPHPLSVSVFDTKPAWRRWPTDGRCPAEA